MKEGEYPLLSKINSPEDMKKLTPQELLSLSTELRRFIIDVVSCNPGHLGASLGVVELTVALHYVFNAPFDKIIWDVGHQAYGHKILTGRRDIFHTQRKKGGLSGFPTPKESEYDAFGVGHSSTSISAALGMAIADKLNGIANRNIVAVIGDGSMTAGMAFEALNNAGASKANMIVVLNDNRMSISPNVGAFSEYLLDITTSNTYNKVKNDVWRILGRVEIAQKAVQKIDNAIKSLVLRHSNLFEALGFRYFGPIDGHDLLYMTRVLEDLKKIPGPKLLHIITQKGKGFKQAEMDQVTFHAPGKFDKETGELVVEQGEKNAPPNYQDVFGYTLTELAGKNHKIVGVTPAMLTGCSMHIFQNHFPERTYDVGIAEQHAVTFSAGLAINGMKPYCNIYSSFMQRAYDQAIHDVILQDLPVVFCLDRGGLLGADGATHQGAFDISYFRCIPNVVIAAPKDEIELRNLMFTASEFDHPIVIRYPRGRGVHIDWQKPMEKVEIGKGERLLEGEQIAILALGHTVNFALRAAKKLEEKGIKIGVYNMRFAKPIDNELVAEACNRYSTILTVEDGSIMGGFGSGILEIMQEKGFKNNVIRLGIPDKFIEHATQSEQYEECGYNTAGIIKVVENILEKK
ncbi:MAG TPA: 1-deoxy-D-xylulose-5-phosphate synthase [Bacteroidales bacterium]|nr:1-deoxy-D-xylulose-5-phosphate synthase [Bacteroidales bacterium]